MPIGSSKIGVLGGLVPGGTETFNAPGTFSIPPGVRKVSITGRGGTGNPGNAGNAGNAGNRGSGGAGGGGGGGFKGGVPPGQQQGQGTSGGHAWFTSAVPDQFFLNAPPGDFSPQLPLALVKGGKAFTFCCGAGAVGANPGQSGQTGNAGTAGTAGNAGNPGCSSSGLCNTFPGGAGGNAGVAGAAGNGGTGGGGGGAGVHRGAGGSGGSGGGSGGSGGPGVNPVALSPYQRTVGMHAGGGGGAGTTNSGETGQGPSFTQPGCHNITRNHAAGGQDTGFSSSPVNHGVSPRPGAGWSNLSTNTFGGSGAILDRTAGNANSGFPSINISARPGRSTSCNFTGPIAVNPQCSLIFRKVSPSISPSTIPNNSNIFRNGGGGGSGNPLNCISISNVPTFQSGGGGGGGGRGNAGNAGGASPTPTGAAGTPQTFNCITVTPGGTAPITVASPGGQVVISWNPQ